MLILDWNDKVSLQFICQALAQEQVLLGTSDTVIGLLAHASPQGAVQLDTIKQRREKPYIVLTGSIDRVEQLIAPESFARLENLFTKCWPGPVTIICPASEGIPSHLAAPDGTIAVRIPRHEGLQELLRYFFALFSTSANITGAPVARSLEEVDLSIQAAVAAYISQKEGESQLQPSTILSAVAPTIRVIRHGSFAVKELEELCGSSFEQ